VISTPLDASGPLFIEQQAASGLFEDMTALHLPTLEAMPELAAEAEQERAQNPRRYAREWLGEYTSDQDSFPIDAFDACVDPDYLPLYADPGRAVVLALDGAVCRDSMALVGVDGDWNLIYAREWKPPKGRTIDHRRVLTELLELSHRFTVALVAYDQPRGLVLDGLAAGLPMLPVSQAASRLGGTMARHAAALVEALHERRLRLYPVPGAPPARRPLTVLRPIGRRPAREAADQGPNRLGSRAGNGVRRPCRLGTGVPQLVGIRARFRARFWLR
jgi:hypothetical protein